MNKRIFIDLHYLKNLNKGFGQFSFHLAKNLSKSAGIKAEMIFYAPFNWKGRFGKKVKYRTAFGFHRRTGIKKHFDVWHSVSHLSPVEPTNFENTKVVYTIHDAIFATLNRSDQDLYKNMQDRINKSSSLVFISDFTKRTIQENFSIPENVKLYTIYNGNPCEGIEPIKNAKLNFPYLLCIGEFRSYKNQEALIPMLKYLNKNLKLVFVGKCSKKQKEKIFSLAKKNEVENRIIFEGVISENRKIILYSNASALVHPSLAEGFGLPVVEAMGFGIPVIISNKTSLPEIGGKTAAYWHDFDPETMALVVQKTLKDFNENTAQKTEQLKEQASKFSWKKAADQYLDVYHDLLK